ncbi:putative uncharacterized domain protein [Xanthomonas citri pv. punicae str. LMG 859]|nr:putative uncharacterized domain protein [Xanthomonas citri pv. punicae str. LMG 859]
MGDAQAISSGIAPPRLRALPALCLPLCWHCPTTALPIRQPIAMNREALQCRGIARNAAAFACDAQHAIAQVMVRATGLKRAQTVRCARAMRARSNTRTACHCTAWPIDPSQP